MAPRNNRPQKPATGIRGLVDDLELLLAGLDIMEQGFAVFDQGLKMVGCNPQFAKVRGYDNSLCVPGIHMSDLLRFNAERGDYGDNNIELKLNQRLAEIKSLKAHSVEQELPDGRTLLVRYDPIRKRGLLMTLIDITQMKEAQNNIEVLARIPEENPNAVLRFNREMRLIYANSSGARLVTGIKSKLGYKAPKTWQSWFQHRSEVAQENEMEVSFDDSTYNLLLTKTDTGDFNVYGRDITELKLVEARVRDLASLPEQNPGPVMRFKVDGELLYGNYASEHFRASLGISVGERLPEEWCKQFRKTLKAGISQEIEHECGGCVYSLVLWPVTELKNINIYGRDTTKLKEAQQALKEAKVQADEASQAKSAFLANMSHELRTPLNAVIGYSELLEEEAVDLPGAEEIFVPDLKKIGNAGKHLLSLINSVLDLSKIEAGKMDLYFETFPIGEMINEIEGTISPLISKNDNQLVLQFSNNLGTMRSDITKVRQTLFNLLSNAAKFTKNGIITLSAVREERDGLDMVILTVADTGIGMTPEQLDTVFEPFSQADASTTRNYGGTGLGLTICQHFCQSLGGDISATSKPGKGTTFEASLAADAEIWTSPAGEDQEPDESVASEDSIGRVLVVDDDPVVRDVISRHLKREGYTVYTAVDGEQALEHARKHNPDIITLDVLMPKTDGWAVLSNLKNDPELSDIPVVLATILENRDLGFTLGAVDYVSKPIEQSQLLTVMSRHMLDKPGDVLIVEDQKTTRTLMARVLSQQGYRTDQATNGRIGLEKLKGNRPDIILLDLMMPEMDGFEFVTSVRREEKWADIPIIVVTAKSLTVEDRARLQGNIDSILDKNEANIEELLSDLSHQVKSRLNPDR